MQWCLILLCIVCIPLTACASGRTINWKEEVQLQDGRMIMVDRVSKQTAKLFPENVIIEFEQTLSFKNPDTSEEITWTIPKGTRPRMLDFEQGVPYFVFRTGSITDYNTWDCPNPPFLVFRYEGGEWLQTPFETLPTRFIDQNILEAAHSADELSEDRLVTIAELNLYFKHAGDPHYKVIKREKINANVKGCFPSTLEKLGRANEITEPYEKGVLK